MTMLTSVIRRVLGDLIGAATLAALTGLISTFAFPVVGGTLTGVFLAIYGVLGVPGYVYWLQIEKSQDRPQWLLQSVLSVGVGALSLIIDTMVGYLLYGSKSILEAAASTGIMFAATLLVCPGYTAVALAGWSRSLIIRAGASASGQQGL